MARLIDELVEDRDPAMTVQDLGDDGDMASMLDACQTPAFLTDRRVIVVRSAGRFRADEVEPLITYLAQPMHTTSLVLVGGGGALPTRLVKAVKEHGHIVDVAAPSGRARHSWLSERVGNGPVSLSRAAIELLDDRVGSDLGDVAGILDALAAAYGEGASLDVEHVDPYLAHNGVATPWELTDAIDSGNTSAALTQLRRMLGAGQRHPLVVMATLQRHFGMLLRLDGAGVSDEAGAAALLGVAPFPAKKALTQSRRLGSDGIARAVRLLAEADVDLRGGSAWPNELVLEVLVARLSKLVPTKKQPVSSGVRRR